MEETDGGISEEHLYKVLVIGDYAVGKTSLIRRYVDGIFTPNYKLTIGVDFALKQLDWENESKINLQLWDIAGHERFGHMTHVYFKYAIAAIVVFDVTRPATFESVLKWSDEVNDKISLSNGDPIPIVMLANKADLEPEELDKEKLDAFCVEHGFLAWFPTSAKDNTNIEGAFNRLVEEILKVAKENENKPREQFVKVTSEATASSNSTTSTQCCE